MWEGESVIEASLAIDRALPLWPRLRGEPRMRRLTLGCDLGGNDDEFAAWAAEVAAHGLPPALTRLVVDRRRHWAVRGDDELELVAGRLALEIDDVAEAEPMLAALAALLARRPELRAFELRVRAKGRSPVDRILNILAAAGPWPQLHTLRLACEHWHERDWVQWLAIAALEGLLAACPALTVLSLPRAELVLERLAHAELRELELGWLGGTPLGPTDRREWGPAPTPHASGLLFLRGADLPALERLAIDFQYDWYVGWQVDDLEALCAASLPRLTRLELRYCSLGDELLRRLPDAPWAAQLERIEVIGADFDAATAAALVAARPRLTRLRELWCFRPHELDDTSWDLLCATYVVRTPD